MKKSFQIFAAALLLAGISFDARAQNTYYWRGQTGGSWSTLSNWTMVTPGNAPLAAVPVSLPTANDDVIFDELSFSSNGRTVTVDVPASAGNLNFSAITRTVTFTVNQPLTIAGSLTLNTNITAVGRAAGNTTGAIRFTSAAPATIFSAGREYDVPVIFDGPGGRWTLQDNMTAGMNVQFVSGHVVALPLAPVADTRPSIDPILKDANVLPFTPRFGFTTPVTSVTASSASHVIGYVQIVNANNTVVNLTLPTGDGQFYRPIIVNSVSNGGGNTPTNIVARYYNNVPASITPALSTTIDPVLGSTLNSVSDKEYWYVGREGGAASPRFTLDYNNTNPALPPNYYRIDKYEGITIAGLHSNKNAWADMGASPSMPPNTLVSMNGAAGSNYGWFTIGRRGPSPLPVHLISFTARLQQQNVQLGWQSSAEENTSHFEVERSADGKDFTVLATVNAQGNSSSVISYSASDMSPLPGTSYYRLKMVDLDQTFSFSKTVAVSAASAGLQVKAYPNPSKGSSVHLSESTGAKLRLMGITDMSGRTIPCQTNNAGAGGLCLSFTSGLAPGFYLATLASADNGQPVRVKFTVQ